ncbi:hypothetical protein PTKIN_Ptkin18bG0042100 [Pterospermum kingtungense]
MAPSRIGCLNDLKVSITMAFFLLINFLLPLVGTLNSGDSGSLFQQSKMVLGSKPPGCVNKCLSYSPCVATLVIPSHNGEISKQQIMVMKMIAIICSHGNANVGISSFNLDHIITNISFSSF